MAFMGIERSDIELTFSMFRMNLRDKYLGSILGLFWVVLNPILLLGMYTFVFGYVFKSKVPGSETTLAYAIWMISGFVPYLAISDGLTGTAGSVVSASAMVKNLVFKVETVPMARAMSAVVPFAVGLAFLLLLLLIDGNLPSYHVIVLVPVIILQFAFLAAVGLFLSAATVFVRDITQVVFTATLLIVFFTPIFYQLEMMPVPIQKITFFNPFFQMTQPYRDVLIDHQWPDPLGLLYLTVLTAALMVTGLWFFRRLKGHFELAM